MEANVDDEDLLPLDATPVQICGGAIGQLSNIWDDIARRTGRGHGDFIQKVFGGIWDDGNTGEEFEAEIRNWHEQPDDVKPLGMLQAMFICCAYACQAMKAQLAENISLAWQYTARCQYWLGVVIGTWSLRSQQGSPSVEFARTGAAARHQENREMKAQVLAWYAQHAHSVGSKDAAAEAMAGKVVPVKFRTVRDWLKGV